MSNVFAHHAHHALCAAPGAGALTLQHKLHVMCVF